MRRDGIDYEFLRNALGDVVAIIKDRKVVARYEYDAWGNHKVLKPNGTENLDSSAIGNINPIRYRGYYYDIESGMYYLQTRYYDPTIGQFISHDSPEYINPESLGGLNLYAYCGNNPVMYVDPSGTSFILLAAIIFGAAVGALEGYISAKTNDRDIGWGIALGALAGAFMGLVTCGTSLIFKAEALAGQLMIVGIASLVTGMSTEALNQVVNNEQINAENIISSGISSMLAYSLSYGLSFGLSGGYADPVSIIIKNIGITMISEPFMILLGLPSKYFKKERTT